MVFVIHFWNQSAHSQQHTAGFSMHTLTLTWANWIVQPKLPWPFVLAPAPLLRWKLCGHVCLFKWVNNFNSCGLIFLELWFVMFCIWLVPVLCVLLTAWTNTWLSPADDPRAIWQGHLAEYTVSVIATYRGYHCLVYQRNTAHILHLRIKGAIYETTKWFYGFSHLGTIFSSKWNQLKLHFCLNILTNQIMSSFTWKLYLKSFRQILLGM